MTLYSSIDWEKHSGRKIVNDEGSRIKHRIEEKIRRFRKLTLKKKSEYRLMARLWDDPIINGLLLSDAHLRSINDGQQSCFVLDVKEKSKDIIDFMVEYFTDLGIGSCVDRQLHDERFWSIRVTSYRNFAFTELRKRWYKNNVKIVPSDILLTGKCLAFWFMGDGSSWKNNKGRVQVSLYTNAFAREDLDVLEKKLLLLNIVSEKRKRIVENCKPCEIMVIPRKNEIVKFMKLIESYMINCFKYKIKYPENKNRRQGVLQVENI